MLRIDSSISYDKFNAGRHYRSGLLEPHCCAVVASKDRETDPTVRAARGCKYGICVSSVSPQLGPQSATIEC